MSLLADPKSETTSQLFCLDQVESPEHAIAALKQVVEMSVGFGYRITHIDTGNQIGLDDSGNPVENKRGNKCRIHFKKF